MNPCPSKWDDVPPAARREVARQLRVRALETFGWPGLLKHLYAGKGGLEMPVSATYQAEPMAFWPNLLADAEAHP